MTTKTFSLTPRFMVAISATLMFAAICLLASPTRAATNDPTTALQRGLFEEEANQNLGAAIQAYQSVAGQFDKDRKLAATAIFRLGECYRKQGNTNDAALQYDRILREFSDQPTLVTLSRQNLATLGSPAPAPGTRTASDAAAAAEAEALALENLTSELKSLPRDRALIALQQSFPNPVLTSLMQKRMEAEQKLAELQQEYGTNHNEVVKTKALVATINKQIEDQLVSAREVLEIKRAAARKTAEVLQAQSATSASPSKTLASGSANVAPTSTEAEEVKRIQALIKDSPDLINARDGMGYTPLHNAAALGQLIVAEFLLANGADVGAKNHGGGRPLHAAAVNGHKAMVELLLNHQASVQAVDDNGNTPLHLAAEHGYRSLVETLLAHAAEVNAKDKEGATPLLLASGNGFKSVADLLLAHGAEINVTTSYVHTGGRNSSGTPLCIAAVRGDQPLVALLLAKGAQVNAADKDGLTPLHLAAANGYTSIVELLLAKGADANAEDSQGRTPLSCAAQGRYEPVVQLLLAAHANPNAGRQDLPLVLAAHYGDMPTLKLLLANGADPNTNSTTPYSPNTKATPLFMAVIQKHAEAAAELLRFKADPNVPPPGREPLLFEARSDAPTLKALLDGGADPNVRRSDSTPLLLQAVFDKNQPAVELLLAHHADVDAARSDGWTPLHAATGSGLKAIAELLLKASADANVQDNFGATPLHAAVKNGQRELAVLLLANKADPNARDKAGQTPLDLAKASASGAQPTTMSVVVNPIPAGSPQPLSYQWRRAPGTPAAAPGQASSPTSMADLLRQHGAADDLPRLDGIEVRRRSTAYSNTAFTKRAHDWGQYTLLDLLGVQYQFLHSSPGAGGGDWSGPPSSFGSLPFPDLAHVRIRRLSPDLKSWKEQVVDLRPVLESGDCSKDVILAWGDVAEIPEADHPLNEKWPGFSRTQLANLKKCLTRRVEIVINGQATSITLAPQISNVEEEAQTVTPAGVRVGLRAEPSIISGTPFWLKPVLLQSKLVLTSSDLRNVKVTRHDAASGQEREWVVDCSEASPAPDFWLRNGDKVEVPERTD